MKVLKEFFIFVVVMAIASTAVDFIAGEIRHEAKQVGKFIDRMDDIYTRNK